MPFVLGLSTSLDGNGPVEPLAKFMTNPAGGAIVNAVGPLQQIVTQAAPAGARRYLVIASGQPDAVGNVVQRQVKQ